MAKIRYSFLILFFFGSLKIDAQPLNLKFEHITSENGLPQNTIHGIAKDKYGFMWFGTWAGLCRYDGYSFKIYHNEPDNPRSISSNRIHNVIRDSQGNIWILAFDDLVYCKYNYETDDFDRIPKMKVRPNFQSLMTRRNHLNTVSATYKGNRWTINTQFNCLEQTYLPTGQSQLFSSNPATRWDLSDPYATDLYMDDQHILWVGTYSNGLNKATLNAKPFAYFHHEPGNKNSIADNNVRVLSRDNQGNLWVGTRDKGISVVRNGKDYLHIRHDERNPNSLISDQIKAIHCDSRGYVWIGTKSGLDGYTISNGRIDHHEELSIKGKMVTGISEDAAGNIWFAAWNGVYRCDAITRQFSYLDITGALPSLHTWVIFEDSKKRIWIGTEGGGVGVFKVTKDAKLELLGHFSQGSGKNTLSDNRVYAIHEDKKGFIWLGTGNGLDRYDPVQQVFRRFPSSSELGKTSIAGITEDNRHLLWVTHKNGISRVNPDSFYTWNYTMQDGLQSNEFSEGAVLNGIANERIYVGGINGYNVFSPDSIRSDSKRPDVVLTELEILNKPVEINEEVNGHVILKKPLYLTPSIELHYLDKSFAIEFAGLYYANPSGNKYAYKLEGFDKDWIYTDASRRVASYSNLSPGTYTFKVKAANSDGLWNPKPTTIIVRVHPAIWASGLAYTLYALILISLLGTFYFYSIRYAKLEGKLNYESLLHQKDSELQQNKIQFFTNISHEIKTPLSLILAPIERLTKFSRGDAKIESQLRTMKSNGDRLMKLINQLLDIRRFETGNDRLRPEQSDIVLLLKEVVGSFSELAAQRNITLQQKAKPKQFSMMFDSDKIEKVLYNLLSNAIKFTGSGGTILANFSVEDDHGRQACIQVIDNGSGIRQEDYERIFLPFQQGSNNNNSGGTGLGLAYSKSLVELHGGTISVESNGDKYGKNRTVFTVRIPVVDADASSDVLKSEEVHEESMRDVTDNDEELSLSQSDKMPILLIVEDDHDMRQYLRESFTDHYQVIEAPNGVEGLESAITHLPDAIISDVMMPDMDGLELCKRIKSDIATSHIPIILLTARSLMEYQVEGMTIGADDYIVKPFNMELLELKVRNILAANARLREKFKGKMSIEAGTFNPESPDDRMLKKLFEHIEQRLEDPAFSGEELCDKVGLSRAQLYRKLKALTGLSVGEIVREVRLKRAAQLLQGGKFHVYEVTYMVGFQDPDYFRRVFKSKFGLSPTDYGKKGRGNSD